MRRADEPVDADIQDGQCLLELRQLGYWDSLLGGYSSPYGAVFDADGMDGLASITANKAAAQISDP